MVSEKSIIFTFAYTNTKWRDLTWAQNRSWSTQDHHLNKLWWASVLNAKHQVSRQAANWFRRRRFLRDFYHIWSWWPSWSCDLDPAKKLSLAEQIMIDLSPKCYMSSFIAIGPLVHKIFKCVCVCVCVCVWRQASWSWDQTRVNKFSFPSSDGLPHEIWFQMIQ